ncbi:MAG TPA: carbohydrate kinase family protein [Gaiellaceae bacterium]
MRPVAIVGSLSLDSAPGREPFPGGCPYHAARALSLLARPSRIVTKCALEHRRLLLGPVLALGIPVSWRPAAVTTGFELIERDERRIMAVTSVGDNWSADEVRSWVCAALEPCEWVHVAPLLRGEFSAAALAEIARGRILSLDGQGLARSPEVGPLALDADFDRELLRHVSVLKLAEEEAEAILHEVNAKSLASLEVPEVIVTRGSRGALVWTAGELTEVPAKPPVANAGATGAGDAFAAIYIAARSRGRSPLVAARRATVFVGAMLSRRLAPAQAS